MAKQPERTHLDPAATLRGRMFLGSLDDSVQRHPWTMASQDSRSLTAMLIYHALLGPRLCCRIGNVLYNKTFFESALDDTTPLLGMCRSGFFELHMRADSFNRTVESRLEEGTNSTIAFREHYGWAKGSSAYDKLQELEMQVTDRGKRQYRAEFHAAFQQFVDLAAPDADPAFNRVYQEWNDKFAGRTRTRSNFELLSEAIFQTDHNGGALQRQAMSIVNSANHYAYGVGMASLQSATGETPFIDTKELTALNGFTRTVLGDDERRIDGERVKEIIRSRAFDVIQRNLVVPLDLFHSPERWTRFTALLDIDEPTQACRDFQSLKLRLLVQVKTLLEANDVGYEKEQLRRIAREFSKFLILELSASDAPETAISASLDTELARDLPGAVAEVMAGEGIEAMIDSVIPPIVSKPLKMLSNVILSITANELENPIRRKIDEFWSKPQSSRRLESEYRRPFVTTLSVKQIDVKAVREAGLISNPKT